MATRKVGKTSDGVDPPPKIWPFPTWKGQPYKPPKQRKKKVSTKDLPDALF